MSDRYQILHDGAFWSTLEHDATCWLLTSDDPDLRRFWIDGFDPSAATNTKRGVDIEGFAWVVEMQCKDRQRPFRFVVSVPQKLLYRAKRTFEIESVSINKPKRLLEIVVASPMAITKTDTAPTEDPIY